MSSPKSITIPLYRIELSGGSINPAVIRFLEEQGVLPNNLHNEIVYKSPDKLPVECAIKRTVAGPDNTVGMREYTISVDDQYCFGETPQEAVREIKEELVKALLLLELQRNSHQDYYRGSSVFYFSILQESEWMPFSWGDFDPEEATDCFSAEVLVFNRGYFQGLKDQGIDFVLQPMQLQYGSGSCRALDLPQSCSDSHGSRFVVDPLTSRAYFASGSVDIDDVECLVMDQQHAWYIDDVEEDLIRDELQ